MKKQTTFLVLWVAVSSALLAGCGPKTSDTPPSSAADTSQPGAAAPGSATGQDEAQRRAAMHQKEAAAKAGQPK